MARIRSAKPDFWSDPLMCSLERDIRFTFKGIWEVCADDHGRFLADARVIKGAVWPMDDDISLRKIEAYLLKLAEVERIQLYVVHGVRYGWVRKWLDHQRVSHPTKSRFPEPPPLELWNNSGIIPETLASDSVQSGAEGIGEERIGSGAEEIGRAAVREDHEPADGEPIPPPRVTLPAQAFDFLNLFYPARSEKERDRYHDVRAQLYDALDPKHPGPKLRGGKRAKARDAAHLEQCCADVMRDPPNNGDMAIVLLLNKLLDPPKGPTRAEIASDQDKAQLALEEQYHAAMHTAGVAWAKANPDEYEGVRKQVDIDLRDATGLAGKIAKESTLAQRCGRAAGFPNFDQWQRERRAEVVAA